ncbi:MAG: transcription termination factor Rho [Gemmatimonadales bacterium]|nr:transcription termination factor Rho [Gemmatimonadota bacterium]MCL4215142.1 transcription termination factor Rho [Gemmatimonadales bacterium]
MDIASLRRTPVAELQRLADETGLTDIDGLRKQDLILRIERALLANGETLTAEGTLEIVPEGHGFLRSPDWSYLAGPDDVYVSQTQVRRFGIRTGDTIRGSVRPPKHWEKFLALLHVDTVNGLPPEELTERKDFDALTPRYPDQRIRLESESGGLAMRVADLIAPLGKGQRGLIVAPPRAGKTILLQRMANAIAENHPEIKLIVLLIDERPEEVTDFIATVPTAEVIASTFDEPAKRHVQVADMVIEKAKRLVECGQDVVILLDSITRLARAHNTVTPMSGKILSGGVDAKALEKPKRFFGAARRIERGGSLTIVATALVSTGSRMDEVIFEEFKGTGNMEIVLDRDIANRRIYPAFEIGKSGTRKEELLLTEKERNRIYLLRHFLGDLAPDEATSFLLRRLAQTKTNEEFFERMAEGA